MGKEGRIEHMGLPCSSSGEESTCNVGDMGSINVGDMGSVPELGRSPGEGKGHPLQYSGLENSINCSPWGHKELDKTEQLSGTHCVDLLVYF